MQLGFRRLLHHQKHEMEAKNEKATVVRSGVDR
jgi:hypothetical protein